MTLPDDATKDMIFGGAFHTAILEPEKFKEIYAIQPQFDGHPNSNIHKDQKREWREANATKVPLTKSEMERLAGMQKAVRAHPTISALLYGKGKNELSFTWRDSESNEMCKGRIDRLCRVPANVIDANLKGDCICIIDLKKTSQLHRFDSEVAKYGYHGQLAFYRDGIKQLEQAEITPIIIAVQDDPPFDVIPFTVGDAVEHGAKLYRRLMRTFVIAKKSNKWPGMCPVGTVPIILPKYAEEVGQL